MLWNTAKNLATHHEKITITEEIFDEYDELLTQINELIIISKTGNNDKIVAIMKKIVPEFKSMNSVFQTLDIDINDFYVNIK